MERSCCWPLCPSQKRVQSVTGTNRRPVIDYDDQLRRYFGSADIAALTPAALSAGVEHMLVDLGLETDGSRRFALWSLLFMLGAAPDLDTVFTDRDDQEAAREFMIMIEQEDQLPD